MDIFSYMLGANRGGGSGGGGGGGGGSNEDWIIGDGNTHIWINLLEGRTSPMLGVCPNGTVTVDWGDGSEPDVLTGTSTSVVQWTPNHEYAAAGDYVITLIVDGEMVFSGASSANTYAHILRCSNGNNTRNYVYQSALKKIEIGDNVPSIETYAFYPCVSLTDIIFSNSVTTIGSDAFSSCPSLTDIVFSNSVTTIGNSAFSSCGSLANITLPDSVTSIGENAFSYCYGLKNIIIPNSVTSIGRYAFKACRSLASISVPNSVANFGDSAFSGCYGMKVYDFTNHTAVPTLSGTSVFQNIPADCEIRVPAALVDEWKAATNWSTYADYIVGV